MGAKSLLRAFDLPPLVASNGPTTSSRASAISRERRHAYRPAPGSAPRTGSGAYLPQQREKPFPVLLVLSTKIEWRSLPREVMCQVAPGTSGVRGRLTRQKHHSVET